MDFDRLDAILKERRISRRKLALATGINEHTMSTAFRRKIGLSVDETIRIANFLGVDYYYLEGWDKSCDENFIEYYSKDGMMIDAPLIGANDPAVIRRLNRQIDEQAALFRRMGHNETDELVKAFDQLNVIGRLKVQEYIQDLLGNPEYRKSRSDDHGQG